MDSIMPIYESVNKRNLCKKKPTIKNKDKMHDKIKSSCNENFMIFKAYAGTAFSFQWSLTLSLGMTRMTFWVTLRIESKIARKLNRTKISTDKTQTKNRTK